MSTVVKDLGAVSAYAYAVEKGYTGTEAEFAELMADYAEVGQRAEDAADSALESKTAAQTAATTATNKASEATTAATTATNKAAEAQADADAAALDASQAMSAASTATTKATEATTAAATATSAATTATTAKDDAVSAKTAAQTAQTGAETAAASVQSSAAQIATNADDIAQLKEELSDLSGLKNLTYTQGAYIALNVGVGNTVDLTPVSNSNYVYATSPCVEGDKFTVSFSSANAPRGYAFIDSANTLLSVDYGNRQATLTVTAPQNAVLFITDCLLPYDYNAVKGTDRIKELENGQDATDTFLGSKLSFPCYLRLGLNIDTISGNIEIPTQRVFVGNEQVDIQSTTIAYDTTKTYGVVTYNKTANSFSIKYSILDTFTSDDYVVCVFYVPDPMKGYYSGYTTINGKTFNINKIMFDANIVEQGFDNSCYTWWTYPHAIRYKGICDKTYIGYVDNNGNQGVMAYSHYDGSIKRHNLRSVDAHDDHNAPSVNILNNGKVIVALCGHMSEDVVHVYVSANRENIGDFTEIIVNAPTGYVETTYAQVFYCGGKWWLFFRCQDSSGNTYWAYSTSTDGVTWATAKTFLDGGEYKYYCVARAYNDTTIKMYMQSNATLSQTDIRIGFIDTASMNVLNADKSTVVDNLETLATPINFTEFTVVCPASGNKLRLLDFGAGTDMSFVYGKSTTNIDVWQSFYAKWNGTSFEFIEMPEQGTSFSLGLAVSNGVAMLEDNKFALAVEDSGLFRIALYELGANNSFVFIKNIDTTSGDSIKLMRPEKVVDDNAVVYTRGLYTDNSYLNFTTNIILKDVTTD